MHAKEIGLRDREFTPICVGDVVEYCAGSKRHIRNVYLVEWAPEWMRKAKAWSKLTHLCFRLIDKDSLLPIENFYVQLFETEAYCRIIGHTRKEEG